MKYKNQNEDLELYMEEISRLIPYPTSIKSEALHDLRIDIENAMNDAYGTSPTEVFGLPSDVARNVIQGQNWHENRASWSVRLVAWGIDLICKLSLAFSFLVIGFVIFLFIIPLDDLIKIIFEWEDGEKMSEFLTIENIQKMVIMLVLITPATILFMLYNIILESYYSTTIGKKLLNLAVVDQSGIRISKRQAIVRNLSKIILGEILIFDVILGMILVRDRSTNTQNQRGLDIIAETIVIHY
jgi:uncharacterized RDD family membrane protein YckC